MKYAEACRWLQLDPAAPWDISGLKQNFRQVCLQEHPDTSCHPNAPERFQTVVDAHQYLLQCIARGQDVFNESTGAVERNKDTYDDSYWWKQPTYFSVQFGPEESVRIRVHKGAAPPSNVKVFAAYNEGNSHHCQGDNDEQQQQQQAEEIDYDAYIQEIYESAQQQEKAYTLLQNEQHSKRQEAISRLVQKQRYPLLDEWVKVMGHYPDIDPTAHIKAVDYQPQTGMYVVKWTQKGHAFMAMVKPEDLRLVEGEQSNNTTPSSSNTTSNSASKHNNNSSSNSSNNNSNNNSSNNNNNKRGPKMIKLKVKCPKDKKPGDTFEIKNPHDSHKKVKVRVPPRTEPGKSFSWMVQVGGTSETTSTVRCAVCARDLQQVDANDKVALRSCPHTCCTQCLPLIETKSCLTCHKPKPTTESLQHLPYLQEFHAPPDVLDKLLEEYYCQQEFHASKDTAKAGKCKELHDHASEQTTKAVNKHYRKMSIKLHPDKNGEEFRPQFELFAKARNVLVDPTLRSSYLEAMLEVVCKVDLGYLPRSHQYWIDRHAPEKDEAAAPRTGATEPGQKERHLQLDGGFFYNQPRKPRVVVCNNQDRIVHVRLPVKDEYQFMNYCEEAVVMGSCSDIQEDEIRLAQIANRNIVMEDGEVLVRLVLPVHSIWNIKWYFKMDQTDTVSESATSAETTIDLRSEKHLKALKQMKIFDEVARQRVLGMRSTLRKYKTADSTLLGRQEIEARYWDLHRLIANGRSLQTRLRVTLEAAGETSTTELVALDEVLKEASLEKGKLEELFKGYAKRDARKNFKTHVAEILETGEAASWLESVSNDDLVELGAEANRLYQLLIEGKKANSLMLDGSTLLSASKRSDLFSAKQCEVLQKRGEELEEEAIAEADRVAGEARKLEEAEKERLELEAMADLMPRGTLVRIHGLVSQRGLNGNLATFMGIGRNKRYIIRLFDGRDVSLKKNNFSEWDESEFGNENESGIKTEGKNVGLSNKSLESGALKPPKGSVHVAEAPTRQGTQQKQPLEPRVSAQLTSSARVSPSVDATHQAFPPSRSHTNGHIQGPNNKSHSYQPIGSERLQMSPSQQPIGSKSPDMPRHLANGYQATNKSPAQQPIGSDRLKKPHQNISPEIKPRGEAKKSPDTTRSPGKQSKKKRCNMGVHCRFLRQGPNVCKYFHPPEDVAQVHPMQPLAEVVANKPISHHVGRSPLPVDTSPVEEQLGSHTVATTAMPSSPEEALFTFLTEQEPCFKCSAKSFYLWLQSEDISTLTDLCDAVEDEDYVDSELVINGLKKFKRTAFKKSVKAAVVSQA